MSIGSFNQTYKKVINTFRGVDSYDDSKPEHTTLYENLFSDPDPVAHKLNTKAPPKKVVRPSGSLASNLAFRQKMYASVGGLPHPTVINLVQQSISNTTSGSVFKCFGLPSDECVVGANLVVDGVVPVRLRELFRRSAGSANVTINEVANTTTFSGGLSAFEKQHPSISFLHPKQKKNKECDLTGLCVTDDDYVQYENGRPVLPLKVGMPNAKQEFRNRALADVLGYIQEINPNITGKVVAQAEGGEPVFRLFNTTPEDLVHLDFSARVVPVGRGANALDRYVMFQSGATALDPILQLEGKDLCNKVQWHRVRAVVILVTLFLLMVGLGVAVYFLWRAGPGQQDTGGESSEETRSGSNQLSGGARMPAPAPPTAPQPPPPDTLSVMIDTLKHHIQTHL